MLSPVSSVVCSQTKRPNHSDRRHDYRLYSILPKLSYAADNQKLALYTEAQKIYRDLLQQNPEDRILIETHQEELAQLMEEQKQSDDLFDHHFSKCRESLVDGLDEERVSSEGRRRFTFNGANVRPNLLANRFVQEQSYIVRGKNLPVGNPAHQATLRYVKVGSDSSHNGSQQPKGGVAHDVYGGLSQYGRYDLESYKFYVQKAHEVIVFKVAGRLYSYHSDDPSILRGSKDTEEVSRFHTFPSRGLSNLVGEVPEDSNDIPTRPLMDRQEVRKIPFNLGFKYDSTESNQRSSEPANFAFKYQRPVANVIATSIRNGERLSGVPGVPVMVSGTDNIGPMVPLQRFSNTEVMEFQSSEKRKGYLTIQLNWRIDDPDQYLKQDQKSIDELSSDISTRVRNAIVNRLKQHSAHELFPEFGSKASLGHANKVMQEKEQLFKFMMSHNPSRWDNQTKSGSGETLSSLDPQDLFGKIKSLVEHSKEAGHKTYPAASYELSDTLKSELEKDESELLEMTCRNNDPTNNRIFDIVEDEMIEPLNEILKPIGVCLNDDGIQLLNFEPDLSPDEERAIRVSGNQAPFNAAKLREERFNKVVHAFQEKEAEFRGVVQERFNKDKAIELTATQQAQELKEALDSLLTRQRETAQQRGADLITQSVAELEAQAQEILSSGQDKHREVLSEVQKQTRERLGAIVERNESVRRNTDTMKAEGLKEVDKRKAQGQIDILSQMEFYAKNKHVKELQELQTKGQHKVERIRKEYENIANLIKGAGQSNKTISMDLISRIEESLARANRSEIEENKNKGSGSLSSSLYVKV